jgi:hypothetical protein
LGFGFFGFWFRIQGLDCDDEVWEFGDPPDASEFASGFFLRCPCPFAVLRF